MYELKEFYDNWIGGMPAGAYQADTNSFNSGDFNTAFFSDGRYAAYYTQSYDWVVNTRELMPIDLVDPIGYLDSISSSGLASGWTCDQDAPNHSNRVDIYSNGTLAGFAYATLTSEAAVNSWCGGGTAHRYLAQLAPWARGTTLIAYGLDYTWYGFTQLACGNCSWPDNPPVASFTVTPAGRAVTTDASASTDDVGITSYQWTWGDGQTGSGTGANHTYASNGTYTIGLTVTDTASHTNSTSHTVTVTDNNPVASFTVSCPSLTCNANGSASSDDLGITQYQWNWGDGQTSSGGPTSSHTYAAAGSNVVTLTVTDTAGQTNATTRTANPCIGAGITTQPVSNPASIPTGGTSALTITVNGTAPVSVLWYTLAGSYAGSGTSINVTPTVTTTYYAVVSNGCASVQSLNVTVAICSPGLGTNPTATPSTITAGQVSRLDMSSATGSGTLTYLWYKSDGTFVASTTAKKLNVTPSVTTSYYYKVSNSCGPTTGPSPTVTVTVQ
jgi:PKD repeat protein